LYSLLEPFAVSTDDSDPSGDKLLRLLRDNQIDLTVVEGFRLVIAFNKIKDPSDRRVLIELAERFAR
jgi:molybdopterin-guanine dinucleotide biosynthesis protein